LFYKAFFWLEEKAIFPIDDSFLNQSYSFISACDFMRQYAAIHKKKKNEINERFKKLKKRGK
jgi:hypothetical protein